jgi:chromosome segregation ATPase
MTVKLPTATTKYELAFVTKTKRPGKMNHPGKPTQEDINALKEILEMLESKRARLDARRTELQQSINSIHREMQSESDRQTQLQHDFAYWNDQIKDLPTQGDSLSGQELINRISTLKEKIASSKVRITRQTEEKQDALKDISASPTERTRRTSLRFIHHALLNELSDLVRLDADPSILQQKEKQIQLCEAVHHLSP